MDPVQQNIITELGIDKLPPEQQTEVLNQIGAVLFQGVIVRALESMTDEEQDKVDAFLGEHPDDPEALMAYLRANVPNFDQLASDEVARFKASAMELMNKPVA